MAKLTRTLASNVDDPIGRNIADTVLRVFNTYHITQDYKNAVASNMNALHLSRSSVTSYLPYKKCVYFPADADAANISADAERQRHYRAVTILKNNPCEESLWNCIVAFQGYEFRTFSGLPFTYQLKTRRDGAFTKELWIDRRENSKSLAWSSVLLAYRNIEEIGAVVDRPKALGDIRGVSYIYGIFYRFGLIDVPDKVKKLKTPYGKKHRLEFAVLIGCCLFTLFSFILWLQEGNALLPQLRISHSRRNRQSALKFFR